MAKTKVGVTDDTGDTGENPHLVVSKHIANDPRTLSAWLSNKAAELAKLMSDQKGKLIPGTVSGHRSFALPGGGSHTIVARRWELEDRLYSWLPQKMRVV